VLALILLSIVLIFYDHSSSIVFLEQNIFQLIMIFNRNIINLFSGQFYNIHLLNVINQKYNHYFTTLIEKTEKEKNKTGYKKEERRHVFHQFRYYLYLNLQ